MSTNDRLFAAVSSFVRQREGGTQAKRHVTPLVQFIAAELVSRGVASQAVQRNVHVRGLYSTAVKLRAKTLGHTYLILIVTQAGSVRNNLTNRCRDILGDAVNLRYAEPEARLGCVYVIRADDEARRRNTLGQSPIDDLISFMSRVQQAASVGGRPILDACAIIAAAQERSGRVQIDDVGRELDVRFEFFDRLLGATSV